MPRHSPCFYTCNASADTRRSWMQWADLTRELPPYGEDTELGLSLVIAMACRCTTGPKPSSTITIRWSCTVPTYSRQRRAGRAAVQLMARHPELRSALDIDAVADVRLREQFYTTLLRYAFILGVEDALLEETCLAGRGGASDR